jgi:hypothetical protein
MPKVLTVAEVDDLEKWEQGFRTHGDLFRSMAATSVNFATNEGNQIAVCVDTADLETFMKVYKSPATADAMKFDGIKRETVRLFVLDKELKL